jgi:hypothetical protein
MLTEQYMAAVPRFALANFVITWAKIQTGYKKFWTPIEDYTFLYVGPVYLVQKGRNIYGPLSWWRPGQYLAMTGTFADKRPIPVQLPAISLYALDTLSILIIHTIFPLFLVIGAARAMTRHATSDELKLIAVSIPVIYGIVLFNLVEVAENNRYRQSIEPLMLALTFAAPIFCLRIAAQFFRKRFTKPQPSAAGSP